MEKSNVNRRNFLRMSAIVGSGSILAPAAVNAAVDPAVLTAEAKKIPTRALGKTGVKLPMLSMGVMRADNPNVVRAAYNAGMFHFDTAHGYQGGKNEEMLGNFFKDKPRDSFFIATKIKISYSRRDGQEQRFNEMLELSLKRLQMDYVDILYTHSVEAVEEAADQPVLEMLKKAKAEGKARYIGISTHASKPQQLEEAIKAGVYDVILLSYNFKLNNLKEIDAAIEKAAKAGIGIVAMKTMTGGVEDASGKRKINAQACLKWAWQNKNITTIIPGFTNFDEMEECLAAANSSKLSQDEKTYLASLTDSEMLYCQQCQECVPQCPNNLPIPAIMRAYMYAYGYKFAQLSKETLLEANIGADVCSGCDECKVTCPSGFNVAAKIAGVVPVLNVPNELLS